MLKQRLSLVYMKMGMNITERLVTKQNASQPLMKSFTSIITRMFEKLCSLALLEVDMSTTFSTVEVRAALRRYHKFATAS